MNKMSGRGRHNMPRPATKSGLLVIDSSKPRPHWLGAMRRRPRHRQTGCTRQTEIRQTSDSIIALCPAGGHKNNLCATWSICELEALRIWYRITPRAPLLYAPARQLRFWPASLGKSRPLSPSSIIWYQPTSLDVLRLGT